MIERLLNGLLGPDERLDQGQRFRWYEAVSGVSALQWIAVPWTLAALMWTSGDVMAPQLAILYAVFIFPTFLGSVYVTRKRVKLEIGRVTPVRIILGIVVGLPFPVFVAGYLAASDWERSSVIRIGLGVLIGSLAALGILLFALRQRRASVR